MPRPLLCLVATIILAAAAPQASAQAVAAEGPRLELARAGVAPQSLVAVQTAPGEELEPQKPAFMRRPGGPLMLIGGIALLGGAIIGGDAGTIVMLGGLGVGIYGVYLYSR